MATASPDRTTIEASLSIQGQVLESRKLVMRTRADSRSGRAIRVGKPVVLIVFTIHGNLHHLHIAKCLR